MAKKRIGKPFFVRQSVPHCRFLCGKWRKNVANLTRNVANLSETDEKMGQKSVYRNKNGTKKL